MPEMIDSSGDMDMPDKAQQALGRVRETVAKLTPESQNCYDNLDPILELQAGDLRAVLALLEWQPIETAPKDGTPILLYWPGHRGHIATNCFVARWNVLAEDWLSSGQPVWRGAGIYEPTHWMPLPEPPSHD